MAGYDIGKILENELKALEGIHGQNPETGEGLDQTGTYLGGYTNRLFGSPFQLLDSVDKRFPEVNNHLGNEYLRNFILNSPILRIRPGLPRYTGGDDVTELKNQLKQIYQDSAGGGSAGESALSAIAKSTAFSAGSKLQKRMFGFREMFDPYMNHVNYMCRAMAILLNLTASSDSAGKSFIYPNGCYTSDSATERQPFEKLRWQNYRMIADAKCAKPSELWAKIKSATMLGAVANNAGSLISNVADATGKTIAAALNGAGGYDVSGQIDEAWEDAISEIGSTASANFSNAAQATVSSVMAKKITSVNFMVTPASFEETLTNTTKSSVIENTTDSIQEAVGSEIAFITGSTTDRGIIGASADFLGNVTETAAQFVNGLTEPMGGGFASNLFNGALASIKGQKMIYPKIYSKSSSSMDYTFTVHLSSPYGDVYNYYMNIVVPICHLICLAAPRMVTSNAVSSPFLVQAFIPGMCTCQLGIIKSMTIKKNPKANHVSVNGFPLDVEVTFQIEELYNAMSISPVNDPASYLFNETLNDYMSNLAGLIPSRDTLVKERKGQNRQLADYFYSDGKLFSAAMEDFADAMTRAVEDALYVSR